jgi:hypothetical protein
MWLQAAFTREDLAMVLGQLTPLRIRLGEGTERYLYIGRPVSVELIKDRGLRIRTRAKIRWDLIGIHVPVTLRSLSVVLTPEIVRRERRDILVFHAELEDVDLSVLPAFVDRGLVALVNKELQKSSSELAWDFLKTLNWHFALPAAMSPPEALDLYAAWGEVKVTKSTLALAISFRTRVHKAKAAPAVA